MVKPRPARLSFFLIAFGYSWLVWGAMWVFYGAHVPAFKIAAMFGPALACIVSRAVIAREGFGDAGLGMGLKRLYPLAWLWMPAISFLALLATVSMGYGSFGWNPEPPISGTIFFHVPEGWSLAGAAVGQMALDISLNTVLLMPITLGEDLGWHGYVVPKLVLRFGKLKAAWLFGAIWAAWHFPVILMGHNNPDRSLIGAIVAMVFIAIWGVSMAWFRIISGSLWVPVVAHAAANACPGLSLYMSRDPSQTMFFVMVLACLLVSAAAASVHLWRRDRNAVPP